MTLNVGHFTRHLPRLFGNQVVSFRLYKWAKSKQQKGGENALDSDSKRHNQKENMALVRL